MADYWKSNPRYFCEICKCWLADNKASIEFHEGGRRHKANVQKQLKQARFRSAENEKELAKTEHTLAAIEQAALQAYQKDLAVEFGEAVAKKANLKVIALREKYGGEVDISGHSRLQTEEQDTSKIKDEIQANVQKKLEELEKQKQAAAAQQMVIQCSWQLCYSPEGYPYYYNTTTGDSQWEVPPEYQQLCSNVDTPLQSTSASTSAAVAQPTSSSSDSSSTQDSYSLSGYQAATKRTMDQADVESREVHQPSKQRPGGAYGTWSTVAVYERTEEPPPKESNDGQEDEVEDGSSEDDEAGEDKLKFEEKTVSSLGKSEATAVTGAFKGFVFKKRAGNRPQIRRLKANDL